MPESLRRALPPRTFGCDPCAACVVQVECCARARLRVNSDELPNLGNYDIEPLGLEKIRTYPLATRKSKVSVRDFVKQHRRGTTVAEFLDSLPRILAADDLRAVVGAILRARARRKAILWGLGGHVFKVGLAPVLIDLIRRGFASGVA